VSSDLNSIVSQFNIKMANLRRKTIYEFENFRLDAGHLMLYQNEREISLAPKVIETLLALVERRNEVLSKDELMELVWADSIVEEGNLSQNLYLLRKTLGDGKNGKPLIETFRRRGYRFNGEVKIIEQTSTAKNTENVLAFASHTPIDSGKPIKETRHGQVVALAEWQSHANDDNSSASQNETSAVSLKLPDAENLAVSGIIPMINPRSRQLIAICAILAAIVSIVAVWKIINQNRYQASPNILASLRIKPLINWDAEAGEGSSGTRFSPNGTMIAYSLTKNGQRNIWTKQIPDGKSNAITDGKWNYFNPIWSPDGQRIAFISNRDNQLAIWTMPFSGGELTPLKAVESGLNLLHWSKNQATIFYQQGFNLFALDIASKQITQLTNFDSTNQAQFFNISPGEDRIAYASGPNERLHIFVMDLNAGQPVQVTNDEASDEYPFWLPDGERIIYSSKRDGIFQTCIIYLNENKSEQLNIDTSDRLISDVSPGGDKILFSQSREESDLWQSTLDEKGETQITSDSGLELWSDISPDGKTVALQTVTESKHLLGGSIEIYSNDDKQEIKIAANGFSPIFSPDGRRIAFLRYANNLHNIWVTERYGTERQLTTKGIWFAGFSLMPYNRVQVKDYNWSPDGSSLIYSAKDNNLWNIWQVAADGLSEPQQISTNTEQNLIFSAPLFSTDGEQIAFVSSPLKPQTGTKQMSRVHLLSNQKSEVIFSSESFVKLIGWKQPGNNLIIAMVDGKPTAKPTGVKLVQISGGNVRTDLAFIDEAYSNNIQLSPNEQLIAYAVHAEAKDNIQVFSISSRKNTRITSNAETNIYVSGISWSPDSKTIYYGKQKKTVLISMIENFK
jgi:Tol biopolymer transport system component/DNA-binding winged helix-turn-helix (wHTH) protein